MTFEQQRLHLSAIILYFIFIQQYGPKRFFPIFSFETKKENQLNMSVTVF